MFVGKQSDPSRGLINQPWPPPSPPFSPPPPPFSLHRTAFRCSCSLGRCPTFSDLFCVPHGEGYPVLRCPRGSPLRLRGRHSQGLLSQGAFSLSSSPLSRFAQSSLTMYSDFCLICARSTKLLDVERTIFSVFRIL